MKKVSIYYSAIFFGLFFLIFRHWFLNPQIIGGDWPFIHSETLENYSFYFYPWNPFEGNGFGGVSPIYSLGVFHGLTVFIGDVFNFPWPVTYKLLWFGLFIGFSIFSSIFLVKTVFPHSKFWQKILASIIYCLNTYILMVVSGGQIGVALAYSVAPLVLARYMLLIEDKKPFAFTIQNTIIAGLALALQVMFDPRIAYLSLVSVGIYIVFATVVNKLFKKKNYWGFLVQTIFRCSLSFIFVFLLHFFWILPLLLTRSSVIPQDITSLGGFIFFSFADFSHAFSLLHPNWPEIIFGKTYFLKAEYLLFPIFAYLSLFFLSFKNKNSERKQENKIILFFCTLGLFGVFLAKGANPPFGEINIWLFNSIFGMNFFRDPTKFYLLTALSYSVLIPFSALKTYEFLSKKNKIFLFGVKIPKRILFINTSEMFQLLIASFFLFVTFPAWSGQVGGTFKNSKVPKDYILLKNYVYEQPGFFRTLWIPRQHRFSYYSLQAIPVEAGPLFKKSNLKDVIAKLDQPDAKQLLSDLSIRYVIVPYDPNAEIFIKDRKYDSDKYHQTIKQLNMIPWLKRINGFGKIAVFATEEVKDHVFLKNNAKLKYDMVNPSEYNVAFQIKQPQTLFFAENYNPYWVLMISGNQIKSEKTRNGLNSFALNKQGLYKGKIVFLAKKYYFFGAIISGVTLLVLLSSLVYHKKYLTLPNE